MISFKTICWALPVIAASSSSDTSEDYNTAVNAAIAFWDNCGLQSMPLNPQTREFLVSSSMRHVSPDDTEAFKNACDIVAVMNYMYQRNSSGENQHHSKNQPTQIFVVPN